MTAALNDRSPHPLHGHVQQCLPPGVGLPRLAFSPKWLVRLDDASEGLDELLLIQLLIPLPTCKVADELSGGLGYLLGMFGVGLRPVQLCLEIRQVLFDWNIMYPWYKTVVELEERPRETSEKTTDKEVKGIWLREYVEQLT